MRFHVDDKSAIRSGHWSLRFDADVVVHGAANPLLAAEITFGCLHRDMSEKELNLVQFSARRMAQLRA